MSRIAFGRGLILVFLLAGIFGAPQSAAAAKPAPAKKIVVSLSQQRLYAYTGNTLNFSLGISARGTRTGNFRILDKAPWVNAVVRGWRLPYWMGIYYVGRVENGIHGAAMLRNGTTTLTSLGCIVLRSADAARLYAWAAYGTPVVVRY